MKLFRLPEEEPLADNDPALAQRLLQRLLGVLQGELGQSEAEAQRLASEVVWLIRRERDGLWLCMGGIGVSGTWREDEGGLDLYVRQLAYDLTDRSEDFEP